MRERRTLSLLSVLTIATFAFALSSCKESGEEDDLAEAQSCLDAVPGDQPGLAASCLPLAAPYSSTRANVLKCSIYMTAGGLIENKIVKAYKALKDGSLANKEAVFMAALSLELPTVALGYDAAVIGNGFCQASGSAGLQYVGAAVVAGTYLNKVVASLNGGAGVDVNDPAAMETAVKDALDKCTDPLVPDGTCQADLPTLGATTIALADAYCGTASANEDVCSTVETAVSSANGDPAKVGQALFCYLNKKTYDFNLNECL